MADSRERMEFRRLDEGDDVDFAIMARVHKRNVAALPDLVMGMLTKLKGDAACPVDRCDHSLQTATRALQDGRDEEDVVCALLHDIGEPLGPFNHGDVAAAVLRPFISEPNFWMLAHHPVLQVYFYGQHMGINPNERDDYRDSPHFDRTAEFCALYDEVSFDRDYGHEPTSTFGPMVRRLLNREWVPPT